jgi:hypothetical protein
VSPFVHGATRGAAHALPATRHGAGIDESGVSADRERHAGASETVDGRVGVVAHRQHVRRRADLQVDPPVDRTVKHLVVLEAAHAVTDPLRMEPARML